MESTRVSFPLVSSRPAHMSPAISQAFASSSSTPSSRHVTAASTGSNNTSQNPSPAAVASTVCGPSPFHMNFSSSSLPSADYPAPLDSPFAVPTPSTAASSFPSSAASSSNQLTTPAAAPAYPSQPPASEAACPLPSSAAPHQSAAGFSAVAAPAFSTAAAAAFHLPAGAPPTAAVAANPPVPATAASQTPSRAAATTRLGAVPAAAASSASASTANGAGSISAATPAAADAVSSTPQPPLRATAAAVSSPTATPAAPAVLVVLSCEQQLTAPSSTDFSSSPETSYSSISSSSSSSCTVSSSGRRCVQGGGGRAVESADFLAEAGVSLPSLLTIHHVFENTGISYRIATPTGHPPAVSNVSAAPAAAAIAAASAGAASAAVAAALEKSVPAALYEQLLHPLPLRSVKLNEFQGLLLPHHLGAALDLLHSAALAKLVAAALPPLRNWASNKKSSFSARGCGSSGKEKKNPLIVCAVGYGAFALCAKRLPAASAASATAADLPEREEAAAAPHRWGWTADAATPASESPFEGYVLTSVSPFDECRYPFFGQLPYMLQELLEDNGASFVSFSRSLDSPACVIDRNVVTGPSEASTQVCLQVFALLLLNAAAAAATDRAAAAAGTPAVAGAGASEATVHAAAASAAASVQTVAVAAVEAAAEERQHQLLLLQQRQQQQRQQMQHPPVEQHHLVHQQPGTHQRHLQQQLPKQQEKLVQDQLQPWKPVQQQQLQPLQLQQQASQQQQPLQQQHLAPQQQQLTQQQQLLPQQHEVAKDQQQLSELQQPFQQSPAQQPHHHSLQQQQRQTLERNNREKDFERGVLRVSQGAAGIAVESSRHTSVTVASTSGVAPAATSALSLAPAEVAALPNPPETGVSPRVSKICSAEGGVAGELFAVRVPTANTGVTEEIHPEADRYLRSSTPVRAGISPPTLAQTSFQGSEESSPLQNVRNADAERQAGASSAGDPYSAAGSVAVERPGGDGAAARAAGDAIGSCSSPPCALVVGAAVRAPTTDAGNAATNEGAPFNSDIACTASTAATPATMRLGGAAGGCSSSRSQSNPSVGELNSVTNAAIQRSPAEAGARSSCGSSEGGGFLPVERTAAAADSYQVVSRACVEGTNSERESARGREDACSSTTSSARTSARWNPFEEREDAAEETASAIPVTLHLSDTTAATSNAAAVAYAPMAGADARDAAAAAVGKEKFSRVALSSRPENKAAASHLWSSSRYTRSSHISGSGFGTGTTITSGANSSGRTSDSTSTCNPGRKREGMFEEGEEPFNERARKAAAAAASGQQQSVSHTPCQKPEHTQEGTKHEGNLHAEDVRGHVPFEGWIDSTGNSNKTAPVISPGHLAPRRNFQLHTTRGDEEWDYTADPENALKTCSAASDAVATAGTKCTGPTALDAAAGAAAARARGVDSGDSVAAPGGSAAAVHCAHTAADDETETGVARAEANFEMAADAPAQSGDAGWPVSTALHRLDIGTGGGTVLKAACSVQQSSKAFYSLNETGESSPRKVEHFADVEYSSVAGSTERDSYWSRPKWQQQQHSIRAGTAAGTPFNAATSQAVAHECAATSATSVLDVAAGGASHISGTSGGVKTAVGSDGTSPGMAPGCQASGSTKRVLAGIDEQIKYADETRRSTYELNSVDAPSLRSTDGANSAFVGLLPQHDDGASVAAELSMTRSSALHQRERQVQQLHHQEEEQQEEQQLVQRDQLQEHRLGVADERKCHRSLSTSSKTSANESVYPRRTDHITRVSEGESGVGLPELPRVRPTEQHGTPAEQGMFDSQEDDEFGNFVANPGAVPVDNEMLSLAGAAAPGSGGFASLVDMNDAGTADSAVGADSTPAPARCDAVTVAECRSGYTAGKTAVMFEGFSSGKTYCNNTESRRHSVSPRGTYDGQQLIGPSSAEQEPFSRSDWFQWQ